MDYNDAMESCANNNVCRICHTPINFEDYDQKDKIVQLMKRDNLCFCCAFWKDKIYKPSQEREIINGVHYIFYPWIPKKKKSIDIRNDSYYVLHGDGSVRKSNNVTIQGKIPDRFKSRLKDTARFITKYAYNKLKDNVQFSCNKKGCFDRYHCYFYNTDIMERYGAWNKIPSNHVVGSEGCELFLDKDKVFIK